MSVTVKYKNNIIATFQDETKILTTAGTWVEDNIEITDTALIDGDLLGYGGETIAVVGEGLAGYTIMGEATLPSMGTAVAGLTVVGG